MLSGVHCNVLLILCFCKSCMDCAEINFNMLCVKANYFDVSGGKDGFVDCLLERIPTYCSHANQVWCQYQCTGPGIVIIFKTLIGGA